MSQSTFSYGIMLNGFEIKKFQWAVLQSLNDSGLAKPCVIIIPKKHNASQYQKFTLKKRLFSFFSNRIFKSEWDDILPLPSFLHNIPVVEIQPITKGKYSTYFSFDDIENIRRHTPDFILRFGFNIIRGDILNSAPYGIWSFHHGDERFFRGGPFAFWEIFYGKPCTGIILQQLSDALDAGNIIERRIYQNSLHSFKETRAKLLAECSDMPLKALKSIITNNGHLHFLPKEKLGPIFKTPSNAQTIKFLLILLKNRVKFYRFKYFKHEKWALALFENVSLDQLSSASPSRILAPASKNLFWADSFFLNNHCVVAEEYSYRLSKGKIVAIDIENQQSETFLKSSQHLAYPFIFKDNLSSFLIPEMSESGAQSIYKIENRVASLIGNITDFQLVDSSLLKYNNKYYLFASQKNNYPNEKLFIFFADTLFGPYDSHPLNPVKVDVRGARMAGAFISKEDKLIRPAQNSAVHYGESIELFEILELSPTHFHEQWIGRINPPKIGKKNSAGTHTISFLDNKILIDFKFHRFIFSAFWARLNNKY